MIEPVTGLLGADVVIQPSTEAAVTYATASFSGLITLTNTAPRVWRTAQTAMDEYVLKQRRLVIRHSSDDRIIALIEIVSPGNKDSRHALRSFVEKATVALYRGYHLLIADLHPPSRRDPQGIHGAIWSEIREDGFTAPSDKPLTLVAYSAGQIKRAFIEPIAVGDVLPEMPLFLEPEAYVNAPLEATYQAAYHGVPMRWKRVLEG